MNKIKILFSTDQWHGRNSKEIISTHKTIQGAITRAKLHGEESNEPLSKDDANDLLNESQTQNRMTNYLIEEYELLY